MLYLILKFAISAALIVAISEIAKRHSGIAALLASLPITSLLAFIWLRIEHRPAEEIASLSLQIFWLVLPSLALFVLLAALLRHGWDFWLALGASCAVTIAIYLAAMPLLRRFGVML